MSLRDTLLKAQSKLPTALSPAELITEWLNALSRLQSDIKDWLREYENEKLIKISERSVITNESGMGVYHATTLSIDFGPSTIVIAPVGRLVVGAVGRVDMYRKDISAESDRFLILRLLDQNDRPVWHIQKPNSTNNTFSWVVREFIELNKESFEAVFDALARRK